MQSVSSRIWTRVAVSISYDDNDYTTGTSETIGTGDRRWSGRSVQAARHDDDDIVSDDEAPESGKYRTV